MRNLDYTDIVKASFIHGSIIVIEFRDAIHFLSFVLFAVAKWLRIPVVTE